MGIVPILLVLSHKILLENSRFGPIFSGNRLKDYRCYFTLQLPGRKLRGYEAECAPDVPQPALDSLDLYRSFRD
jgi:hypothetical protein